MLSIVTLTTPSNPYRDVIPEKKNNRRISPHGWRDKCKQTETELTNSPEAPSP